MAFKATLQQKAAIDERGNILVCAAAGSGKTAVLVERVISRLTDKTNPVSADSLLIVTFTNAAAAEMRGRIEKRLDEECRNNPNDIGLLRQKHLISTAKICTIDSFCIDLVRENFDKLGISPDFKICDEGLLNDVNERVARQIFEEYLEEGSDTFYKLIDITGSDYDESKFVNYLLDIYRYSRQLAKPEKWFEFIGKCYSGSDFKSGDICFDYAFQRGEKILNDIIKKADNVIDYISFTEGVSEAYIPYLTSISENIAVLLEILNRKDWDAFYTAISEFSIKSAPNRKNLDELEDVKIVKSFSKLIEGEINNLKKLFFADSKLISQTNLFLSEPIKLFSEMLSLLDKRIFEEYLNLNSFTFHNTEHLALKLLEENEFLASDYCEVMVDEYQDVNDLQDRLFYILSSNEKNLFVVGDVKQSIYGFRGANPENFINKKERYLPLEVAKEDQPKRITLGNNFRSRKGICDFVNFFFENIMSRENGGIDYGKEEALIPSALFPENGLVSTELHIITNGENAEQAVRNEAAYIADYIKKSMKSKPFLRKGENELKSPDYSDFAILMRSPNKKAMVVVEELRKRGIPVNYTSDGYADSTEVAVFLALLKIIDNPMNNIEMLCVLLSPIFGFTPDEVAKIRADYKTGELYSAVVCASENGNEKAKQVVDKLVKYRRLSVTVPLSELIIKLLYETLYIKSVLAMENGTKRRNNLLLLPKYAQEFSSMSGSGIDRFIEYIKKQSDKGLKSACANMGENAVKLMSIHGSKGLQFPVCIIADTAAAFNESDTKDYFVYNTENGLGVKYFDNTLKEKVTTLLRQMQSEVISKKSLSEELRLLYVAMTRAEERLVFIASPKKLQDNVSKAKASLISENYGMDFGFKKAKSYFDWLVLAAMLHPDCHSLRGNASKIIPLKTDSKLQLYEGQYIEGTQVAGAEDNNTCLPNSLLAEKISENINYEYPYDKYREIQTKASVSAIANKAEAEHFAFSARPDFMCGGVTATGIGTAMHKVIQFFDFSKAKDIDREIDRLCEWQFITEQEAQCVNKKALKAFFESKLFDRIKNSDMVKREMRFLTEMPASLLNNEFDSEENIIVQGAVDLCFEENGEIVVLDFKTDRVSSLDDLKTAYSEQLEIYSIACEKIFSKPVKQRILYSFNLGKEIVF